MRFHLFSWPSAVTLAALLCVDTSAAQETGPAKRQFTDAEMGAGVFELHAKVACGEGRADAVDYALREALEGADLLPDRAAEMRRGIREAHAALVNRGGCRSFPAADLARIRQNQENRSREISASGGEMKLELPAGLGGKLDGKASYGTVAVGGAPMSVICMETRGDATPRAKFVLLSPSKLMLKEGRYDLADIQGSARLSVSPAAGSTELQYGMLGISEPEGNTVRGSLTGFLRAGMEMFSAHFTAVPSEDPCGIKAELASVP
jgi:hypothetical protein